MLTNTLANNFLEECMAEQKKDTEAIAEQVEETEAKVAPAENDEDEVKLKAGSESATEQETEAEAEDEEGAVAAAEEAQADVEEKKPSLEEELELARQEAANNFEGWQRAVAELANFKRRKEEQLKLQRDRIKGEVLEGVISALDDMDLAFQNVPEEIDGQLVGWVEGFRLVQRKLNKVLEDQNVMPIDTEGEFDPNVHEAVSYEASDEHEEGQIIGELRKGYQVGSRVLRPALVRVAK
jgi:molecular chaperone GrpE